MAEWDEGARYAPGATAELGGLTYRAQWGTRGTRPPAWPWEPVAAAAAGLSVGAKAERYTNVGSPIAIPTGGGAAVQITDALLDAQDDVSDDVVWDSTNDRFDVLTPGIYEVWATVSLDLSSSTGGGAAPFLVLQNGASLKSLAGPVTPAGSTLDVAGFGGVVALGLSDELTANAQLRVRHELASAPGSATYAEFAVRLLQAL